MIGPIQDFCKKIIPNDLVLFYFSGHGYHFDGKNYLIPIKDADMEDETDIPHCAANVQGILDRLMGGNPPYATIMILDCCRPYFIKNASTSSPTGNGAGLCELKVPLHTFIQFSCAANQTVIDDWFTTHLLRNIVEKNVNITDVFQRISNDV
ncbi:unnamed protein product, partial [Rotaria sp. Silwood2]